MNIIKYKISDNEYLKINPDECVHEDECQFCAHIDIDYIDEKNNICIRFGYNDLSNFCYFFTESKRAHKLLERELILSKNIVNDLGFEWNQFYAGKQKSDEVLSIIGLVILINKFLLIIIAGYIMMKMEI
jgi:hypothetical protein